MGDSPARKTGSTEGSLVKEIITRFALYNISTKLPLPISSSISQLIVL